MPVEKRSRTLARLGPGPPAEGTMPTFAAGIRLRIAIATCLWSLGLSGPVEIRDDRPETRSNRESNL
jgi:hypothetical protein